MDFRDTGRRRRFLLLTIGVALALVAGWSAYSLGTRGTEAPAVVKQPVLVAARDVAARETVTADDVVVREVAVDEVLAAAYAESTQVVGRVTAVPIYANQQLTPSLFASTQAGSDFSILEPDEVVTAESPFWRAVALEIPKSRAVGGQVQDGQHIDLIISVGFDIFAVDDEGNYQRVDTADDNGFRSGPSTKISMQDVEVLKSDPDANLYVLKVDLHQAEQIAHVQQVAPDAFSLALRPEEDTRQANHVEYGTTTDALIMTYYYRVPELVDLLELLAGSGQLDGPLPSNGPLPLPGASDPPGEEPDEDPDEEPSDPDEEPSDPDEEPDPEP